MKKYLGWTKKEWIRILQHMPIGIIAPFLGTVFGACFIALFLAYQFVQEYNNKGKSHIDIAGAIAGLPIGVLLKWTVNICLRIYC